MDHSICRGKDGRAAAVHYLEGRHFLASPAKNELHFVKVTIRPSVLLLLVYSDTSCDLGMPQENEKKCNFLCA